MNNKLFTDFFQGKALEYLYRVIDLALEEDGQDLTSNAVFSPEDNAMAVISVKQDCVLAGLPLIAHVFARIPGQSSMEFPVSEGDFINKGGQAAIIQGSTRQILKAERVVLNFLSRLSGIATLTRKYCRKLEGTGVRLLDTRKTTPGLRYPEKYAVMVGGGENHRLDLESLLMIKDNHIDQCSSISGAVNALKQACSPCPPIEVECRSLSDVKESVRAGADRIMLDNMDYEEMAQAMKIVPKSIETEISGRVDLENIQALAALKPTFISSGALTHSAAPIDVSMTIKA